MSPRSGVTLLYDASEDEQQEKDEDQPVYQQVQRALSERGHEVKTLAATADLPRLAREIGRDESAVMFNLCEALGGVDAHATHVASSLGLGLARDKSLAKKIFAFHGLPYPKFSIMRAAQVEWSDELQFPLFVKPCDTDSSVGIDAGALVHDIKGLMERISFIHTEIRSPVLIEEFIDGRELFVSVLGNENMEALPIVEWDFSKVKGAKFATAEAKWDRSSEGFKAPERFPTDIPDEVYRNIQTAAVEACKALHIFDYGRVDVRLRVKKGARSDNPKNWQFYIIEANPNPYLEQSSEVAMAARKSGLAYGDLLERIIDSAERRGRFDRA